MSVSDSIVVDRPLVKKKIIKNRYAADRYKTWRLRPLGEKSSEGRHMVSVRGIL